MANANQILSLIHSHYEDENERFSTLALQIAAHEAKLGHASTAQQIKSIIDKDKLNKSKLRVIKMQPALDDILYQTEPNTRLNQLVLPGEMKIRIERILTEYLQRGKLKKHGLSHRRKIMLVGPPGTGKTMTASVIASELKIPLYSVQMDRIITKYLGETGSKLRQLFDFIETQNAIFFFDEFDTIGSDRSNENEVGEMKRALNSLLQFIDASQSESLIIAATNNVGLLDKALFRRFDDILYYKAPNKEDAIQLIANRLGTFGLAIDLNELDKECLNLSHAQLAQACEDSVKESILNDSNKVSLNTLEKFLREKKQHD